MNTVSKDLH